MRRASSSAVTSGAPFDRFRARYLVFLWLLTPFYLPGFDALVGDRYPFTNWYWYDVALYYYGHALFVLLLVASVKLSGVSVARVMGGPATAQQYRDGVTLTVFCFFFATAAIYALFYPLSFAAPDFVDWWYLSMAEVIYYDEYSFPAVPNLLNFLSLCIIAPVVEEFVFRGLLLQRWAPRFGLRRAVILSSLLFGIVHPDPLGAFVFGVAMSILYLRTQSLALPMVCHGLYNLAVWLIELGYVIADGPGDRYLLEDFRADWPYGVVSAIVCLVWTVLYFRNRRADVAWRLPA